MGSSISLTSVGGPTLLVELGGIRLLTDPTFDPPGTYPLGTRVLVKTAPPAFSRAELGVVDAVLLSHDQHPDNLDTAGREALEGVPLLLSTPTAAARLPGVEGLAPWEEVVLPGPHGGAVRVAATPAQHGPDGTEDLTGPVTGFVLSASDLPTVYISGDNASMRVVNQVAERFPVIDVAVLFAGAAQTPLLGEAYLTLTSAEAAEAARRLAARWVLPAHFNSWAHYSEGADRLQSAFADAKLSDRLVLLSPGERATIAHDGLQRDSRYSSSTSRVAPAREVTSNSSGS
ncbi:MAG: MBL fold metallo-hydrolase [Acidimicrobiales bacterium]